VVPGDGGVVFLTTPVCWTEELGHSGRRFILSTPRGAEDKGAFRLTYETYYTLYLMIDTLYIVPPVS